MPVTIPESLPSGVALKKENIFFMTKERAIHQDIRPLKVALLNLMPNKIRTEEQFLRLLGNSALQVEMTFLTTATYKSKHTPQSYLKSFYKTFEEVRQEKFDALIITGSPVETMEFEQVAYWKELEGILDWADEHVFASMFVCWAAQAALHYYHGTNKYQMKEKLSGIYSHRVLKKSHPLVRGFDDTFWAPHSRHTSVDEKGVYACKELEVLADSPEAGLFLLASKDGRKVFVTGHSEYDEKTLEDEYLRDQKAGLNPKEPVGYYQDGKIEVRWRGHAHLLFSNWLNYHVYQNTPYQIDQISKDFKQS